MAQTRALLLLFTSLYLLNPDNVSSEDTFPFRFEESDVSPPDPRWPDIDENDVVALTEQNFKQFVDKNEYVMVMFYAQWCYWSRKLAPDFVAASQSLKDKSRVVFAMVDAFVETRLGLQYRIEGYPTMYLFVHGINRHIYDFSYDRSRDAIVSWLQEKVKIGVHNITTMEEAVHVFNSESMLVLGVVDSLEGSDSEELVAAANMQPDINFYQTADLNVAEFFHVVDVERPALVLMRSGKYYGFDGRFTRSAIVDFVSTTRNHPPVKDTTSIGGSLLNQIWLFAQEGAEVVSMFEEAAEEFRGKGFAKDLLPDNGLLQSGPASVLKLPSQSHDGHHTLHFHI